MICKLKNNSQILIQSELLKWFAAWTFQSVFFSFIFQLVHMKCTQIHLKSKYLSLQKNPVSKDDSVSTLEFSSHSKVIPKTMEIPLNAVIIWKKKKKKAMYFAFWKIHYFLHFIICSFSFSPVFPGLQGKHIYVIS